jgi:hypothetical protein
VARALDRGQQQAVLDVLLEVGAVELAAQHLARAQLAGAELTVRGVAQGLALHLHSSAPRLHT